MVVRSSAAPPTPWSQNLADPDIHETAYVHSSSNIIGDVRIGAKVIVAPGTSIRADEGFPFYIGQGTKIQDGVVVHGLQKGRVVGDDGQEYSAWIGDNSCITHMALVHGPVYIGSNCFVGFRSTVFNARVGKDCIVMMHALVQDVEIPPGKYVCSGSVITNQQQADRLPNVQEADRIFADRVVAMNEALRAGVKYVSAPVGLVTTPDGTHQINLADTPPNPVSTINYTTPMEDGKVNAAIVQQVKSLLAQGYRVGTEHADRRRFKTSSWLSCPAFQGQRAEQVLAELEACLTEHAGEYVRLIGIDPAAKRRVLEVIIQDPNYSSESLPAAATTSFRHSVNSTNGNGKSSAVGSLSDQTVQQVRSLLQQGYRIGTEHADKRRFKTSSWLSCAPVEGKREAEVFAQLEACLAEHAGEYVRLIGIDPAAKRRVSETIIQDPNGVVASSSGSSAGASLSHSTGATSNRNAASAPIGSLSAQTVQQVRSLLQQGHRISTEHADKRRFKTSSWLSCAPIEGKREAEVFAQLEACLAEHAGEYVRLIGIDPAAKRRVSETIIQDPTGTPSAAAPATPSLSSSSSNGSYSSHSYGATNGSAKSHKSLSSDMVGQVRSLLQQGYRISTEHADKRRFKTSSWLSCAPIQGTREAEVLSQLEACLADHSGEYVRLIGIDPGAKRRVLETIVQDPAMA